MATTNAAGQEYSNESDGFKLAGGGTKRQLTVTGANVTLNGSGSNTYTFPASTDTLVGRSSTDSLANKTISLASNTLPGTTTQFNAALSDSDFATLTGVETLTNKRLTPRVGSTTSSATPTVNTDLYDQYNITALATNITSLSASGSPADGQKLMIRISGPAAHTVTWNGTYFISSGSSTLLTSTVAGKTHLVGFIYDSTAGKWVCVASDGTGY